MGATTTEGTGPGAVETPTPYSIDKALVSLSNQSVGTTDNVQFEGLTTTSISGSGSASIEIENNLNLNSNNIDNVASIYATNIYGIGSGSIGINSITNFNGLALTACGPITTNKFVLTSPAAPSTSSAAGTAGEIRFASGYLYICVATNTWQRVAIATW